jgi:translation initiation factor IF-2
MGKIKIQEIAAEAGMSNNEAIAKAKELGFDVKVAGSSISFEQAEILVDYALTGKLPDGFSKPGQKPKMTVKKQSKSDKKPKEAAPVAEETAPEPPKETEEIAPSQSTEEKKTEAAETPKKKVATPPKGVTIAPKKEPKKEAQDEVEEEAKPRRARRPIGRGGITIVKKAKPAPTKASKSISLGNAPAPSPKKKKSKRPVEAKTTGEKLEILGDRGLGASVELYEEEEVVLLDFSDKNIYEEMKRQEERRRAEAKKREQQQGNMSAGARRFQPQQRRSIRRGGKKKRYVRQETQEKVSVVKIPEDVRVYEFAEKVGKSVGEVVKVLFALGTMVTKNDFLDKDSIEILAEEFEVQVETINPLDALDYVATYDEVEDENAEVRPPVITIMGHVDHGKTSLLDMIRSTKVAAREAGGITQHVGAYQVEKNGQKITFVDTPGHSAFTEMRARGAMATDIAIIVVAADDGVMPQTKESISHAKAADVPMIFAINKMDKETANPDNVKSQLAEIGILSVDWGGEYEFIPVSAHTGMGIDDLLETILLQAEVMELEADASRQAKAVVVESSVEKGFGPVANIIVKNGTLNVGDNVIVGTTYGRGRTMILDDGSRVKSIGPSTPAAVVGLQEVPEAGEVMIAMESEKAAKEVADKRRELARTKLLSKSTKVSIDELGSLIAEGQIKKLPLIVKADVQGSLEAIKGALADLKNEEVQVQVIHEGVGGITESDVTLADASENAIIVGFNVRPTGSVKTKAKDLGVEIKAYSIIYDLLDDVKALLGGLMSPVVSEEITGQAEVRETFSVAKVGTIAGCMVTDGVIERNAGARLIREGVVIYTSRISSLKRFNDDAKEVRNGFECGIMLENFNDIKVGDVFETFKEVEEQASL